MEEETVQSSEQQEKPRSPISSKASEGAALTAVFSTPDDDNLELGTDSSLKPHVHPACNVDSAVPELSNTSTVAPTVTASSEQEEYAAHEPQNLQSEKQATEKFVSEQAKAESVSAPSSGLTFPKIPEKEDIKQPATVTKLTPVLPANENPVSEASKDENGFIFYKCRFCGLTYNYLTTLRAHERVHNIDEPYKCNRCSESFHYLCELEYHAKQHTDLKGYKCECGRTFHTYTDLLYHKHPDDKDEEIVAGKAPIVAVKSAPGIPESEFPVPEFIEKGFEPKHPLKVYSDVRLNPYICQYCSKSYPNSRMLAYHMYGHRGERIFNPRASRYLMARTENSYISPGV